MPRLFLIAGPIIAAVLRCLDAKFGTAKGENVDIFDANGNPVDPHFGYVDDAMKEYLEQNPPQPGDRLLVYGSQGSMHSYDLVTVVAGSSGKQRRVVVDKAAGWGGTSWYRSGKNCWAPKGQSRLIPLIPWIMDHLGEDGVAISFSWDWKFPMVIRPQKEERG